VLLLTIVFGCSKTDDSSIRLADMDTPTLTGFVLRDVSGSPVGIIGTPNVNSQLTGDPSAINYSIVAYPNPCKRILALMIQTPNPNASQKIWIVKGKTDATLSNSGINLGMNTATAGGQPLLQATTSGTSLTLDVSSLPSGYYRLYVKVEDKLLYDNLILN
jgi:hypothetical protein